MIQYDVQMVTQILKNVQQTPVDTLDHDFPSADEGKLIPHDIYDLTRNQGHMNLNTSHDTSEFCCDSIVHWWKHYGYQHYSNARRLLLRCDGDGSNAANIQGSVAGTGYELLGLEIRVAHYYPPYCLKYNSIEHRLFSLIMRACQGESFIRSPSPNNLWSRLKPVQF